MFTSWCQNYKCVCGFLFSYMFDKIHLSHVLGDRMLHLKYDNVCGETLLIHMHKYM
jgi:hypothetical protein